MIIEVDGIAHTLEEVIRKDEARRADLEAHGFTILRFTDEEVLEYIEHVRAEIGSWIDENAVVPPQVPASEGNHSNEIPYL